MSCEKPKESCSSPSASGLYLTFDDGPHLTATRIILDVLRLEEAKATFFVVGERLTFPNHAAIVVEAAADGHAIGNHTFTHSDLTVCSEQEIEHEVVATSKVLEKLGIRTNLVRPPYGRLNKRVTDVLQRLGFEIVLWNNDPRDWDRRSSDDEWVRRAIAAVHEHHANIIVCHDIHERTANHAQALLQRLASEGYDFLTWVAT